MNYQLLGVMLISAIIMLGVAGVAIKILYAAIPTEEACQRLIGYGQPQKNMAEKMWCEFNETGWHFNKTKYREAWSKTENYVV